MTAAPAPGTAPPLQSALAVARAGSDRLSYQIRWKTIINRSITRALTLNIDTIGTERCAIEAWIEEDGAREAILSRSVLPCAVTNNDGMIHLDVHRQNERILAMTLRESDDELLYCRSDLLARSGFTGGSYDPPQGETTDQHE